MQNNGFFKRSDPHTVHMDGGDMPPQLWIHPWMYRFALSFAGPGMVCADLGTGWHYRPFRYELARRVDKVYAVDSNREVLRQRGADNLRFIVADFTDRITEIEPESLDLVFFIHCLERNTVNRALWEVAKLIKPSGRVIVCADSPYDPRKPLGQWKGLNVDVLQRDVALAGLMFDGSLDLDKTGAVVHEEWNLCNWHCVLRREQ